MSDWLTPIDIYCERLGPGLIAEPLNAFSNIAFMVAAGFAWRYGRYHKTNTLGSYWLIVLLFLIGIGSGLFHTFANGWSREADKLPILIFQLSYVIIYAYHMGEGRLRYPWVGSLGLVLAYLLVRFLFRQLPQDWLNGSIIYFPALIFALGIAFYHYKSVRSRRFILFQAGGCFVMAIIFRSIDMSICSAILVGSHFLWHMITSLALYLAIIGLMLLRYEKIVIKNSYFR